MVNRRGFLAGVASSLGNVHWLSKSVLALIAPPPMLTVSAWADQYAHLSPETSSSPGKFKSFAYQRGIMDAVSDPGVTQITVMKSARIGYTKCLDNIVGYFIHQDPSPMLIVQPRVEDAEDYSRTEIEPILRDTPVLAAITGELRSKDSSQRIVKRTFRNGSSVSFVGANSPSGLRRITARIVCFDEVDGFPVQGAGSEGDQITLGIKRTETFWNSRTILGSTPTIKGIRRIEKAWEESDQRRYYVPCPHCGATQVLKWANALATQIAEDIRAKIRLATKLTASAGISYNKFLAKLASDHRKPDGLFVITPKMGPAFVENLPVEKFHGVGPATTAKMNRLGIATGLNLRAQTLPFLQQHFGPVRTITGSRAAMMTGRSAPTASASRLVRRTLSRRTCTRSSRCAKRWSQSSPRSGGIALRLASEGEL
jgi:Phage terminase large subunit (GpA)/impB/mucB/samB family/IMS family HHH motif